VSKTHIDPHDRTSFQRTNFGLILACVSPYRIQAAGVAACIVIAALFNLSSAWLVKRIIDAAIPSGNLRLLWLCCAGMIVGPIAADLIQIVQKYGAEAIAQDVMVDLRVALYRHLHEMPLAFFARQKPGEAVTRVLSDVQGIGGVVSGTLVDIVQNAAVMITTLAFVMALDWRLGLMAICALPLFLAPARRVGQKRKLLKRSAQARMTELTGLVAETLSISGAVLVKNFDGAAGEVRRFRVKAKELKALALEQTLTGRWFRFLLGLFEVTGPAMVFGVGGWLVIRGQIPLGTVVALVTLIKRLQSPATELANVHIDLMTSYAYFDRVFAVLSETPAIRDAESATVLPRAAGRIEFRNVSFAYADDEPRLDRIDLSIRPGMKVGIVGRSGAGKTTLVSLVTRLYDPIAGSVTIDGCDIRGVTRRSLLANIAVVSQDTFLFHATVFDNLRYGRPGASRTEVAAAADQAHIHDLIASLPDGYDTEVGDRGYRFSAGERQRLAIARAILKDPRIIILDEATSALDSSSERDVQASLAALLQGRTSLVVAHRLSTIRDADLIVVVDEGRIIEQGSHDTLLAWGGQYARLWRIQSGDGAGRHGAPEISNHELVKCVGAPIDRSRFAAPAIHLR
jgi:ATP-binding cassette subfamily B protein